MFGPKPALCALAATALAVGIAAGAGAVSLAGINGMACSELAPCTLTDLNEGQTFRSGDGVLFENFSVEAKGKGLPSLDQFLVIATQDGFRLSTDPIPSIKGGLHLTYTASGLDTEGVLGATLAVLVDASNKDLKVKVDETLIDPDLGKKGKKIDKLKAQSKPGKTDDETDFNTVFTVQVQEKIKLNLKELSSPELAVHGFDEVTVIPEPVSALLLGSGLTGLGLLGRRRRVTRR